MLSALLQEQNFDFVNSIQCMLSGLLQKQHPDVAMSVKSRQAVRSVLNTLRDSIRGLHEDGILDDTESTELETVSKSVDRDPHVVSIVHFVHNKMVYAIHMQ